MKYYPDSPDTNNKGELAVWHCLTQALSSVDEGEMFHHFAIYHQGGQYGHEIDIVVVLRHFGIWIFECKGMHIHNIREINGSTWLMNEWTSAEEKPAEQARAHLFALREWLKKLDPAQEQWLDQHMNFRVALPFITRAQWQEKGFHQTPVNDRVVLAEDLEPEALYRLISGQHVK